MRAFVVLGHRVPLTPTFSLNDLPGSAGRLDVLCRCVNAALFLSHGLRRDTEVLLVLQDRVTVRLLGASVKRLNPDERSSAALIKKALERLESASSDAEVLSTPGIFVARRGLAATLELLTRRGFQPVLLHEMGSPLAEAVLPARPAFVLSDHLEFTPEELALLQASPRLSVGPRAYLASHCIAVVNVELDRRQLGRA